MNPDQDGADPVYWVFKGVTEEQWENCTIIVSGKLGSEYPKTFGHYHPQGVPIEIYHLIEGEGVLQMQKKKIVNGELQADEVEEVYLVKAKPGDEIAITPDWGHSWSNVGSGPLISFDNWRTGHTPSDYEPIEKMKGLAYYLIEENGEVKAVPNPEYKNLPEAKWITASDFAKLNS